MLSRGVERMIVKGLDREASISDAAAASTTQSGVPPALSGERFEFSSSAGRLSAYTAGAGAPLLLIHSINAVGSAAEVQPLYDHYRKTHRVIALDLPGFGFSERSDRVYTPQLMTDAITATIREIQERYGPAPVDALALSLSAEFLARAAVMTPAAFRSISLVSPTGLAGKTPHRGTPGKTLAIPGAHRIFRGFGWSRSLYRVLTLPRVIRYFLERTWGGKEIDARLWQYDIITARAPGAEFAPLYFLSGGLFSADIDDIYERVSVPVWMSHGIRGDFTDYHQIGLVEARTNWRFSIFPTGALPHFEVLDQFCTEFDRFLAQR
jgi:pimeloyl-ACP methyl ester carboxylesterase